MPAAKKKSNTKAPNTPKAPTAQPKAAKPKAAAAKAATAPAPAKKPSALDAAARVLAEAGGSMTTKELIEALAVRKLWVSPNGKTPAATLYAAILREVTTKGTASRFRKTAPGKFAAATTDATDAVKGPAKANKTKAPKGAKPKGAKPKAPKHPVQPATGAPIPDGTPGPESLSGLFRV